MDLDEAEEDINLKRQQSEISRLRNRNQQLEDNLRSFAERP